MCSCLSGSGTGCAREAAGKAHKMDSHDLARNVSKEVLDTSDRGVWRKSVYFITLHWMRDLTTERMTKNDWKQKSTTTMREIVKLVRSARNYNRDDSLHFARELKVVWFKAYRQMRNEMGDTASVEYARMDNNRRDNEGISD